MSSRKLFEIAFRLGASIDPSMRNSFNQANKYLNNLDRKTNQTSKNSKGLNAILFPLKGTLLGIAGAAGAAASALAGIGIKKSMDFEEQLSSIQALTGATNKEMKQMSDLALEMGSKTKYSALEAAQGIEELLKAGITPAQVKAGSLEAALNLATAGGLDLAQSAEIMSTALNSFKNDSLKASDAANILAGTANASATSVEELQYGLSQVSAVASGVGLNFKDTNTALGLFANNGLKGSDAGTSLKTMLSNLTPKTKDAATEMEKLGLIAADGTSKFYDAKGNLKSMSEIAGLLQNSLKGLNSAQRQQALYTMFGSDAIRAANILYKEGASGVEKFQKEMTKVTALDVAKQKMNNAKGAVEQFNGAMETLQISALTPTLPLIKKVALGAADLVSNFSDSGLGKTKNFLSGMFKNAFSVLKAGQKEISPVLSATANGALKVFQTITPIVKPILTDFVNFAKGLLSQLVTFWKENGKQIVQAIKNVFVVISGIIKTLGPIIFIILASIVDNIKGLIQGAINVILGIIKIFTGLFTLDFQKMWEGIKQLFVGAMQVIWNGVNLIFVGKMLSSIRSFAKGAMNHISQMWGAIKGFFTGGVDHAWSSVVQMGAKVRGGMSVVKDAAVNLGRKMLSGIKGQFDNIVVAAKSLPGRIGKGISSMAYKAVSGLKTMGSKMLKGIGKIVNGVIKGLNFVMSKLGIDTVINEWAVPKYARGTKSHPGGLAILGDGGGPELFITPQGKMGLSPGKDTLMNLPKGTEVLPFKQTQELIDAGLIPAYAKGIGNKIKKLAENVKDKTFDIWSYISSPTKLLKKMLSTFGVKAPNISGVFKQIGKGALSKVKESALEFLKEKLASFSSKGGGSAQVTKWISEAISITGISRSWLGALVSLAMKESGGNPKAINLWDSNAKAGHPSKGLMQTIDSTFNRYKMKGMDDIWNPVHNAVAAIRYIIARYKSIGNVPGIKAMAQGKGYVGYANGGKVLNTQWAWVGEQGPELMKLRAGSQILSNDESNNLLSNLLLSGQKSTLQASDISSDNKYQFIYNPTIIVEGNADKTVINKALQENEKNLKTKFMQWLKEYEDNKKRLSFS